MAEGLVELERLAQDGLRVRAAAGAGSCRRGPWPEKLLHDAEARVTALKAESERDPAAARERMKELQAERARRTKTHKQDTAKQKEPRASTTDAEARVMKMPDGGYRPAHNGQFAQRSANRGDCRSGYRHHWLGSRPDRAHAGADRQTYGLSPKPYLVDGGFTKLEDIKTAHPTSIEVFAPPPSNKHATDPFTLRKDDGPGTTAWRQRMASEEGKAVYRQRAKTECVNADLCNRGLQRLLLRGRDKVRAVLLWFALVHNVMRAAALRIAAATAAAPGRSVPQTCQATA